MTMNKASILIVDDNPTNLKLVQVLLLADGHDVRTAIDAEQALKVLESFRPRLILMDIQLPGLDGLELTCKLMTDPVHHDVPVVALTAYAMKGDDQRALDAGCRGYISKPIDTRRFTQEVESYLEGPLNIA